MDKIKELINRRRHQILVHSCIYYKLNENLISDFTFDDWSKELVQLQKDYPELSKEVQLYEMFKDWDGSTGAFLPIDTPITVQKALELVMYVKGEPVAPVPKKPVKKKKPAKKLGNSLF